MKIEKEIRDYYKSEIARIEIPPCPIPSAGIPAEPDGKRMLPMRLAFAALIAIAFIPLIRGASQPSALANRAASVCRTYELDTRISEGLLDMHKIFSKSISTGGKK